MSFNYVLSADFERITAYFIPENPLAQYIVSAIAILGVLWFCTLLYSIIKITHSRWAMKTLSDVSYLATRDQSPTEEEKDRKAIEDNFHRYCRLKAVPKNHPVAVHVGTIYQAGISESRLDVEALTGYTERRIFIATGLLKTILSVFIVLGLLGTLLGLADSMAKLKPVFDQSISQASNERVSQALGELLVELRSAFAPSIDGVLITVIGLLIFSVYLRFLCAPVKQELEWLTRTVWVRELYPTVSQKLMERLVAASDKLDTAMDNAQVVTTLVSDVQEDMSDFSKRLKNARGITKDLTDSVHEFSGISQLFNKEFVTQLAKFSAEFRDSVNKLASFQDEIRSLYGGLAQDSKVFRQSVTETLKGIVSQQEEILRALQCYERAYIEERGKTERGITQFIDGAKEFASEATRANTSISQTNVAMLQQVQSDLTNELQSIRNELLEVAQVIQNIGNPMDSAAEKITRTHEAFTRFMDNRVGEFLKSNADLKTDLSGFSNLPEYIEKLVIVMNQLTNTMSGPSEIFTQPTQTHPSPANESRRPSDKSLDSTLRKLNESIDQLNASIVEFRPPRNKHGFLWRIFHWRKSTIQ